MTKDPWLNDYFIKPLGEYGFVLKGYENSLFEKEDSGVHILVFEYAYPETPADLFQEIEGILIQDDDSQPESTYRAYLGTMWLFIPYFI